MSEELYVMQYPNGSWVRRDDSSGPMSTGGYPFEVRKLSEATRWTDKKKALKYRYTCRASGPFTLHKLELSTIPEIITPGEEAEASGDKEYAEFQRLAKKFGAMGTGECPFERSWVGKCKASPGVGEIYCEKHKGVKCWKCGAQADSDCEHTSQFVCGMPQCKKHPHH